MSFSTFPLPLSMFAAIISPVLVMFSDLPSQAIAPANSKEKIALQNFYRLKRIIISMRGKD